MQTITVKEGQTLLDIAMQYLGNSERVYDIANLNEIEITTDLVVGQELWIPDTEITDESIAEVFEENDLIPASMDSIDIENEGIDFWAIEDDFIVQ